MAATTETPLRRDAARNRERILVAADELFAQRGLGATLNDVAHHAGVGVGTVYRHFPDKAELIQTLFETRIDKMVAIAEAGLADPDPWRGLVAVLRRTLELQSRDRGLHELLSEASHGTEQIARVRARLLPIGAELVRRAQAAGAVRSDVEPTDLAIAQLMLGSVLDASREVAPETWRRCLDLVLRGIATRPDELELVGAPALEAEQFDAVMSTYKTRAARRRA